MTRLEERYRSLLRVLPSGYRATWEEEMVNAFLESAMTGDAETDELHADYGRLPWPEVASVLVLAVRLRTGAADRTPRFLAFARALRLFVLVGLLVHAADGLVLIGLRLWLAGRLTFLPPPPRQGSVGVPDELWYHLVPVGCLAWLTVFGAVLAGRWRIARGVAVLTVLPLVVSVVERAARYGLGHLPGLTWYMLLSDLVVLGGLVAFREDTPRVPARPWLLALPVAAALSLGTTLLPAPAPDSLPLLDWFGLCCLAYLGAVVWYALRRAPDWGYALALLAPLVLGLRLVSIADYLNGYPFTDRTALVAVAAVQAVLVAAAGLTLYRRTRRDLPAPGPQPVHR